MCLYGCCTGFLNVTSNVQPDMHMSLQTSHYIDGISETLRITTCMTRNMCPMHGKNNFRCIPAYKRCRSRFLSCRGWPSHPIVGSGSLAYFFISPHNTAFIDPKGCHCASSSTCFFMPARTPPFRAENACEV